MNDPIRTTFERLNKPLSARANKFLSNLFPLEDRLNGYDFFLSDILSKDQYMLYPNISPTHTEGEKLQDLKSLLLLARPYYYSLPRTFNFNPIIKRDNRDWNVQVEYNGTWSVVFNKIDENNRNTPGLYQRPSNAFLNDLMNTRFIKNEEISKLPDYIATSLGLRLEQSTLPYTRSIIYNGRNVVFNKGIVRPRHDEVFAHYFIPIITGVPSLMGSENIEASIRHIDYYETTNHVALRDEDKLEVPRLERLSPTGALAVQGKYIKINGISFLSADLRLLYNTFLFETLVMTGEDSINLPNVSLEDLRSLRDVFNGMKSIGELGLSSYTAKQLSGDRTMLDIYDLILAKMYIDRAFSIGVPLRQQLANIKIPQNVGTIVRLEELVRISQH